MDLYNNLPSGFEAKSNYAYNPTSGSYLYKNTSGQQMLDAPWLSKPIPFSGTNYASNPRQQQGNKAPTPRIRQTMANQGIQVTPKRRTAFLVAAPMIPGFAESAATIDVDEQFYFKPDAGLALLSPADETPVEPNDAFPEELDIAIGADRVQTAANISISRINHSRAGLRCFADDKTPVVGFDDTASGFFWLAGQGGYGIQTSPALSIVAAALINGQKTPDALLDCGVDLAALSPTRFSSNKTR